MKRHQLTISGLLVVAALVCVPSALAAQAPTGWSGKMRELYGVLAKLVTETSSASHLKKADETKALEKDATRLSNLTKQLMREKKPERDPSITMLMDLFSDQADRAVHELKRGHREYAVELLRGIPGYCIACHTRTNTGPHFDSLPIAPTTKTLTRFKLGKFYAATRQYDRAQKEFLSVLGEKNSALTRPIEWEQSVRYALAIAVRVNQNADQGLEIVDRILSTEWAPYFVKQNAQEWKKSLEEWKQEPARKITSTEGYLHEAERLVLMARSKQKYPADRSADVLYFRASAATHQLLDSHPDSLQESQGYLLAATAYECLRDLGIEDFHEMYYEACIRKSPYTAVAEQCFDRLQETLFADYSGSGGLNLPDDVKSKLDRLESMAQIQPGKPQ